MDWCMSLSQPASSLLALVLLVGLGPTTALARQVPASENPFGRKYPARVYQTVRLEGQPPAVDGRLEDEAWKQGEWAGDYRQFMPTEGARPSQPTEIKILYDDKHVYVAIRAYDDPAKVHRYPGRRDDFNGYAVDVVGVCFDSYNDKRTGFEFDLTAGGAKIDLILGNGENEWDTTWDAVWDGEVAHDDRGWTAEFRVPLSQVRYGPQEEQVWGLHAWRWIARNQEEDQWQLIPRQNTGRMYQLGELRGIRALPRSRHVEVLPHVLAKGSSGPSVSSGGTDGTGSAGLDAKVGLTSDFTLDATMNPDFGQVEADPSVINLTAYETFFEEKRPFFLEGRKILTFEFEGEDQLFHSRRVGGPPSFSPPLASGETAAIPESTTILGAFKVTGKTQGGLSVAALQAITQKETVGIPSQTGTRQAVVEPAGSYTAARVHKDWDKGNTSLGGMLTSTHRWVSDPSLAFLPTQASTGGIDFTRHFANRAWALEASGAFSRVTGDAEAIRALQVNPVHYYQRPDAAHLGVDPGRTSLVGYGGSARFGRSETSRLRLSDHLHWYSPGFDLNDVGYLRQADLIANQVFLGWAESTPKGVFRDYSIQLGREDQWDFGGLQTRGSTSVEASAQFTNKWRVYGGLALNESVDTRALRGGPALRLSDSYSIQAGGGSDSSRRTIISFTGLHENAREGGTSAWRAQLNLRLRPSNRLLLSADTAYTHATNDLQYVTTTETTDGPRWVMGRIDQEVWSVTLRANLTVIPELTLQYYGSPFVATGRYADFKKATQTLAPGYEERFHRYTDSEIALGRGENVYQVIEAGSQPDAAYSFANPDFDFTQFRSNLVVRWEYKPGSSLYIVWSQGRTEYGSAPSETLRTSWDRLWHARPDNVVLVKLTYWLSL
jgi:hypothetical protein